MTAPTHGLRSSLSLLEDADRDWRAKGTCVQLGVDPEFMQPEVATNAEVAEAKALCRGCPVRLECRALARSQESPYGVHGGEWYGPPPSVTHCCSWCERPMEGMTARARYCSTSCKKRFQRAQAAEAELSA